MRNKLRYCVGYAGVTALCLAGAAGRAQEPARPAPSQEQIKQALDEQTRRLEAERKRLADQQKELIETRKSLDNAQRQLNQPKSKFVQRVHTLMSCPPVGMTAKSVQVRAPKSVP